MKDYLNDIVQHTHSLGFIDLIKVQGSDTELVLKDLLKTEVLLFKQSLRIHTQSSLELLVCRI